MNRPFYLTVIQLAGARGVKRVFLLEIEVFLFAFAPLQVFARDSQVLLPT